MSSLVLKVAEEELRRLRLKNPQIKGYNLTCNVKTYFDGIAPPGVLVDSVVDKPERFFIIAECINTAPIADQAFLQDWSGQSFDTRKPLITVPGEVHLTQLAILAKSIYILAGFSRFSIVYYDLIFYT